MDANRFDGLVKSLTSCTSRRAAVVALLTGLAVPLFPVSESAARRKNDRDRNRGRGQDRNRRDHPRKGRAAGKKRAERPRAEQTAPSSCFTGSPCTLGAGANLAKCDFGGSSALTRADCAGCNLKGANLRGAVATSANLSRTNLQNACLVDADLRGATIGGGTNLGGAIFCRTTMPDSTLNNDGCDSGTACCPTCVEVERTGCSLGGRCCGGAVCQATTDGRGICRCPVDKPKLCNGVCGVCCGDGDCSGATPRCCSDNTCKGCCSNAQCPSGICCNTQCCAAGDVCDKRTKPSRCCTPIPRSTACAGRCGTGISDGCGGSYDCGGCTAPNTCGGGGVANVCGCTPSCGSRTCGDNGCGGACGVCGANQRCCNGTCKLDTGADCTAGGDAACCSGVCVGGRCQAACSGENGRCDNASDCCPGTSCTAGVCCASGKACGTTCCASANQVCDDENACCTREGEATTCAGRCGADVRDNCDQRVDCGFPCAGVTPACCDGDCADLASDLAHCGTCATTCLDGSRGAPACCGGACTDLLTDPRHCGRCDAAPCTAGTTPACCGGVCSDLSNDGQNCGACFARCNISAVPNATAVACAGGRCVATACATGFVVVAGACCRTDRTCGTAPNLTCCGLGQTCCGTTCTDTSLDPSNCGGCGRACPAGVSCAGGQCSQGSFGQTCSGSVPCSYTNSCTGNSCLSGQCCIPAGVSCTVEEITFQGTCCCDTSRSCPSAGTC